MSVKNLPQKDRIYKLKNGTPLSFTLPSRNHPRYRLLYFDEEQNINRPLRYASNQKSPFEDEQDGNAILEPIVFEDGMLVVPRTNPVLQAFLHYHPLNGTTFEEVDKEKDASAELENLACEADAMIEARQMTLDQLEMIARVLFGIDPLTMTTAELKRDVLVFAKNNPKEFLQAVSDPDLKYQAKVRSFFDHKLLTLRNNNKEVWFNTPSNKKKFCTVPFNEDPYDYACNMLQSDEGLEYLKMLETFLDSE